MASRGRGYFALYGYIENLKNLFLQKCQADFQIILKKCFFAWPSIRFLQAMLIGWKNMADRGRGYFALYG